MSAILNKDAASCMAVHTKFLALGTHWGMIHILDHIGHNIRSKELPAHTTTVNQISIDDNGDYIASCSDDGRVVINGLYSTDNNQAINFDRPIKAVAMDPMFFKSGSGKHFVTGDDKLVLNEKGFLSRHRTYVLHQGEGPIRNIKWKGSCIAWANDLGVKVYDMNSKSRITFISKDNPHLRPEIYRCSLCWKDEFTLLIGWADQVKVCVVRERQDDDTRDLPKKYVEIVAMFQTEFMVCGIAPLGTRLVVLAFDEDTNSQEVSKAVAGRPHLKLIQPNMDFYDEISNDALSIRGFHGYRCNDYHLESLEGESMYFIVSPKDVVVARQRDKDDHIQWLLQHAKYEEAMSAASEFSKQLKRHNLQDIGQQFLDHLIEEEQFEKAARMCVKILGKNKDLWESEVFRFAQIQQLKVIAPYLPQKDPNLSPSIYEMVMNEYLLTDHIGFQKLIKEWPTDLYSIQTLVNAVLDKLQKDGSNGVLLQCLATLYTQDKRYDKALHIYLKLKHKDVFELIRKHRLMDSIVDKIVLLMEFDSKEALKMLIENIDRVPVESVVNQLEAEPKYLHLYLDGLFHKDPHIAQEFHDRQVVLYAEYDRSSLLSFLRSSNYYPLQQALAECERRNFIPEMVFLLGRMGNTKQALHLITNELRDVDQAIDFCKEHNDQELWQDLINYSIDKPSFITGLLHNIGTHVDPIILIQKIQDGMQIPGLRDSLVRILQDFNLQMSLREGCKKILISDCFLLLQKLIKTQKRGIRVENNQTCHICHERITIRDLQYASNVTVFFCHHAFHEDCLPAHNMESCAICSAQRRSPGVFAGPNR
ncbi:hypothetical protein CAPTEDRAFT_174173 [Capitella teleta]|uniref:Vacuolar protein sorting-associated protein 41 homolog n=1 Tax=Capitella teleta TaxID=283909 RepID=R7VE46_CAPTE|nr:hypothetical protein CAPTEDRAFT_174173 [Capitella teleta]|eukprot:ELU13950.1 hypothetical protein CAPTEDRAFT_174173 [Capitella teleta]